MTFTWRRLSRAAYLVGLALLVSACSGSEPSDTSADFVVDVDSERFILRSTDPATMD